ncbi:MAG: acyl-CoA dehydratase activase [Thermodesulfobacteriota bacterium]|nr:acyl-CoA dehydratase activase [Thermodesulfobacteriota bacterium]
MIVAGCDIGSLTSKAVILKDGEIMASRVMRVAGSPRQTAEKIMTLTLEDAGLAMEDVDYTVGTGYGRKQIPFASKVESEISCHGKGAWWSSNTIRTVIDIGGQDAKAIKLDEDGKVIRYVYNDKCASGTGRFLEIMADALEVPLEDMGKIAGQATEVIDMSSQCVVFAETEIVSLVNDGKEIPDILKALNRAMANRIVSLAKSIGVEQEIVITGGVAKNIGVYEALEERLKMPVQHLKVDPQINGALGAAVMAGEMLASQKVQ